jgi:hypothetical protein
MAGGVEEAERDAAVHPAAHQHRHSQRRPARRRAPRKVLLQRNRLPLHRGAGRASGGGGGRRGGRERAERPRPKARAEQGFIV